MWYETFNFLANNIVYIVILNDLLVYNFYRSNNQFFQYLDNNNRFEKNVSQTQNHNLYKRQLNIFSHYCVRLPYILKIINSHILKCIRFYHIKPLFFVGKTLLSVTRIKWKKCLQEKSNQYFHIFSNIKIRVYAFQKHLYHYKAANIKLINNNNSSIHLISLILTSFSITY